MIITFNGLKNSKIKNFILFILNYLFEIRGLKNYYIQYVYYKTLSNFTYLNYSGKLHREDGPAYIEFYNNGQIYIKEYYLNNEEYSYEDYIKIINNIV